MQRAVFILLLLFWPAVTWSQDFRALARVLPGDSVITEEGGGLTLTLALTQSVPFRVTTYDVPRRLVIDAREVDWSGLGPDFHDANGVAAFAAGRAVDAPGWSRISFALESPFAIETAVMETDPETGAARIIVGLQPTSAEAFAETAVLASHSEPSVPPVTDGRFVVALDPGHGGVDPGAEADGLRESDLMLTFARELAEHLVRTDRVEVVLTRQEDVFVSLPERISIARAAEADVFLSLHADALAEGQASGATVYTFSTEASDAASATLAEQFDRTDLLLGVDLSTADDAVTGLLLELARRDTAPRADAFADRIVAELSAAEVILHPRPRLEAAFSVLKAADIPSVLLEVGFLSSPEDRARLVDESWRSVVQTALVDAILVWAEADATLAGLRQR